MRPLPPFVADKLARVEVSSFSGLFAEVHRAWVTFDDEVLVWNYEDPTYADFG